METSINNGLRTSIYNALSWVISVIKSFFLYLYNWLFPAKNSVNVDYVDIYNAFEIKDPPMPFGVICEKFNPIDKCQLYSGLPKNNSSG